ncbi:Zinc ribbon domain-containing protein [Desulfarculales bacterium]
MVLEGAGLLCPACGLNTCQQMRQDYYLSLFFIPLFPVKRGKPFWQCSRCGQGCQNRTAAYATPQASPRGQTASAAGACRFCGGDLNQGFKYCPYCGARLTLRSQAN